MQSRVCFAATVIAFAFHTATADAQPDQSQLHTTLRSLDGSWQGSLEYRDFQSNDRTTIPIRAELEAGRLAPILSRRVDFIDPGRTILSQDIVSITGTTYTELNPADGELASFEVTDLRFDDTFDWTITLTGKAQDNGVLSDVMVTQTLDGNALTVTRRVRPSGAAANDDAAEWMFRNQISLERADADADQLLGTWQIDLRPSADAAPYTVTMNIESIDDGALTGTFYNDVPVSDGSVSVSWGVVRFAFTTSDGTGTYHTTGSLRNGIVTGTTHSLGRDFLMEWRGSAAKSPDAGSDETAD